MQEWSDDPKGGRVEQELKKDKSETYTWSIRVEDEDVILVGPAHCLC